MSGATAKKAERPCQYHTATTKVSKGQCVAQYKKTVRARIKAKNDRVRRDRAYWPTKPITVRDLEVRGVNIAGWKKIGICEQAGPGEFGVRWNTPSGWKWQGGTGMYFGTHQSVGHPYSRDIGQETWQVQMLVAHRVALKYRLSAWDSFHNKGYQCWTGPLPSS